MAELVADLSMEIRLDQQAIDSWAQLSGDVNPLHVDADYAAQTPFGGTIAHGHLTLALLMQMFVEEFGEEWLHGGALEGVRFRAPVRPGQSYTALAVAEPGGAAGPQWDIKVIDADGATCVEGHASIASESTRR